MAHAFSLLLTFIPLTAVALNVWWFCKGPRRRTRETVAAMLEARGLKLLSLTPKPEFRLGRTSRCLLTARAENAFGNVQKFYFDVDIWADLLGWPSVGEFGGSLSPTRFFMR